MLYQWEIDEPIAIGRYEPAPGENPLQVMAYYLIKRLSEFGTTPWIVLSSSNGTTINNAGVNQINSRTDIVGASPGTAHSWIVYENPFNGAQYCFNFNRSFSATERYIGCEISCSPVAGFSGGSLANRPTATDEYIIVPEPGWSLFEERNLSFPNTSCSIFLLRTTNSECTRLLVNPNSLESAIICMDTTTKKIPQFNGVVGAFFRAGNSLDLSADRFIYSNSAQPISAHLPVAPHSGRLIVSSTQINVGVGATYGFSGQVGDGYSLKKNKFTVKCLHVHAVAAENKGYLCTFDDMFFLSVFAPYNQTLNRFFLDSAGQRYYQYGDIMLPWPEPHRAFN